MCVWTQAGHPPRGGVEGKVQWRQGRCGDTVPGKRNGVGENTEDGKSSVCAAIRTVLFAQRCLGQMQLGHIPEGLGSSASCGPTSGKSRNEGPRAGSHLLPVGSPSAACSPPGSPSAKPSKPPIPQVPGQQKPCLPSWSPQWSLKGHSECRAADSSPAEPIMVFAVLDLGHKLGLQIHGWSPIRARESQT